MCAIQAKICGIKTQEALQAALSCGADYLGFVLAKGSPRFVALDAVESLLRHVPLRGVQRVALVVNPDDAFVETICKTGFFDMIQCHGHETFDQIKNWRDRWGLQWMKALTIGVREDLASIDKWRGIVDAVLLDARPPKGAQVPGGHGKAWDWSLLGEGDQSRWPPWFLAGGLNPENVQMAIEATGARYVDVSSGVESSPGIKDIQRIANFLRNVRSAENSERRRGTPEPHHT